MKKLSLLLMAVAFLCPKDVNAQDSYGSVYFVPYVGVNYSDFSGNTKEYFNGTSGKVNFMAGARFEFVQSDKWSLLLDYNYRRLGAIADNNIAMYEVAYTIEPLTKHYEKITLDCHTLGIQFKHKIVNGLSARIGLEGMLSAAEYWYYHLTGKVAYIKSGYVVGGHDGDYDYENSDMFDISEYDDMGKDNAGSIFSDKPIFAIPIGLTYDYKNFSVNATYHLPLTKCAEQDEYSLRHQAFDLTIGYRLPLRKR